MADRTIYVRYVADVSSYIGGLTRGAAATQAFGTQANRASMVARGSLGSLGSMKALGGVAVAGSLAYGLKASVGEAIKFESSFTGVRKTVDATAPQFRRLEGEFRRLSKEVPLTVHELNRIGEVAGQLGIKQQNLVSFTKTMAQLGATTDLSAEDAAVSLAQLAKITQLPQSEIGMLGDVIVELGNNLETNEPKIVDMGLRLAAAGQIAGLSQGEILGFAGALSSVGVSAEAGGTAFSKVFTSIFEAVETGNEDLEVFAETAGMTAGEFTNAFRDNASGAIVAFIEGLGGITQEGGNAFAVLEALSFTDARLKRALLSTAGAGDALRKAQELQNDAVREGSAATEEFSKRLETTETQLDLAGNAVDAFQGKLGKTLKPAVDAYAAAVIAGAGFLESQIKTADESERAVRREADATEEHMDRIVQSRRAAGLSFVDVQRDMAPSVHALADASLAAREELRGLAGTASEMAERAQGSDQHLQNLADAHRDAGTAAGEQAGLLGGLNEKTKQSKERMEALTDALGGFSEPASVFSETMSDMETDQRERAERMAEAHNASIDAQIDKLGDQQTATRDSLRSQKKTWEDFVGDVEMSLDDYASALEKSNRDHRDWRTNLVKVAGRAGSEVANILLEMGEEGVALTAKMANGTDREVSRMARALIRESKQGSNQAARELDLGMRAMSAAAKTGGKTTVTSLANELGLGVEEVARIVHKYGIELASGLNPVIASVGGEKIKFATAAGARFAGRYSPSGDGEGDGHGFASTSAVPKPPAMPHSGSIAMTGGMAAQKGYDDVIDWLESNLAPKIGPGGGWKSQWAAVQGQFPGVDLFSAFRPGAITTSGNPSYHSLGRAIDITPSMSIFDWIASNYPNATELIYSPAGMRQLWHGQPHMYSGAVRAMHYDHIHWAMDQGGWLQPGWNPPIFNGTGKPEAVLPEAALQRLGSQSPRVSIGAIYNSVREDVTAEVDRAMRRWEHRIAGRV